MQYNIVGGPSKFDLIIAFADRVNGHRRSVEFRYNDGAMNGSAQIVINTLSWEDGSGENWLFKGYLVNDGNRAKMHGYFDSERRRGWYKLGEATW